MAIGETTVTMVGTVVSELTCRVIDADTEVVSFWLKSNERRRDKQTGVWANGRHFSAKVSCWRKLAQSVQSSLHKGDPVVVVGRLHSSDYEVNGLLRSIPELEAFAVGPNLSRCTASVSRDRNHERPGFPPHGSAVSLDSPDKSVVGGASRWTEPPQINQDPVTVG